MSNPSTVTPRSAGKANRTDFLKQYSPRGECPMSFTASAILHLLPIVVVLQFSWLLLSTTPGDNKPVDMDAREVEGMGGGELGGIGKTGPGLTATGNAGKTEGVVGATGAKAVLPGIKDFKLEKIPQQNLQKQSVVEGTIDESGDVWARIDDEQMRAKAIMSSQANSGVGPPEGVKGGTKSGSAGSGGAPKGPGLGNNPKGNPKGQGTNETGIVFSDQRRKEFRWQILASDDGETHLRKLQALKVTLMVPLRNEPGMALKFDLSKPAVFGVKVRAEDDSKKVRWKNDNQREMASLGQALGLKFLPPYAVIYLPKELEADMARRELAHDNRKEHEIAKTVWDLRERDGAFDNEPFIKEQYLKPGVR